MKLDDGFKMIKDYSKQLLIVIVICAPFAYYIFEEYKGLQILKNEHSKEVNSFYVKAADAERDIIRRQGESYKQEIALQEMKSEYESKLNELKTLRENINAEYAALAVREKEVAYSNQRHIAIEQLQKMMSEFSSLGVDLNRSPKCEDSEEKWQKYNMARVKLREAVAYARANGLYDEYEVFFTSNSSFIVSSCG